MSNRLRYLRELASYMGPGFLISVAYMDPGNWATNISGGAKFGTALLWIIVLASAMAMGIQIIAAKLGIATGKGIAQLCRERLPRRIVLVLWAAAELAMIATDMAEIIGAAIGFSLIFNVPLPGGAILAGASSFALLGVRTAYDRGFRAIEYVIMGLVGVIALAFVFEVVLAQPTAAQVGAGLAPSIPNADALYLAIGILGATVMPHSVYLHPYIVQDRRKRLVAESGDTEEIHRTHLRYATADTILALFGAMFVNAAMLVVAAAALTGTGISTLNQAYVTLDGVFGGRASLAFGVALIAAGLSSSLVATMAGQTVMDGFLDLRINVWLRRSVTLVPSLAVVIAGFDPTSVLVFSQVLLSLELPFVLVPLVWFVQHEGVMGEFAAPRATLALLSAIVGVVILLNAALLADTFGVF